jgi:outer membrane protein TolC
MIAVPTTRRPRFIAVAMYATLCVLSLIAAYRLWRPPATTDVNEANEVAAVFELVRAPEVEHASPQAVTAAPTVETPRYVAAPAAESSPSLPISDERIQLVAGSPEPPRALRFPGTVPSTNRLEQVAAPLQTGVLRPPLASETIEVVPAFVANSPAEPVVEPTPVIPPMPTVAPTPVVAMAPEIPPPFVVAEPAAAVAPEDVRAESVAAPAYASAPDPWSKFAAAGSLAAYDAATISIDDARAMALRNNKDVAVLGYAPQMAGATIEQEASAFDPVFNVNMQGGHYFRQTSTLVNALGTGIPTLNTTFWQPGVGLNQIYVDKLFSTGGRVQAGIGQNLASYTPSGDFVFVNPAWQSSLNFMLEQPLFRGRGPVATQALLKIARANEAQSWQQFQALVNQILRDAEVAYWETSDAYREMQLRDMALAVAVGTLEREQERMRIGEGAVPDVAQAQEHVEEYRIDRADAENRYIAAQRELRRVMGIPPDDPRPIIPSTVAGEAPLVVDWNAGSAQAMNRPELFAQRAVVEAADAEYRRRLNGLQPDLAVRAIYSVSGLDSQLDGAWSSVGTWDYNDWTAGIVYRQPLGRRSDNALAQRSQAALAMETARLRQLEHEVVHQLGAAYDQLQATERMLGLQRRRREAAAVQLEARRELYMEGRGMLRDQIDAEERYATAMIDEASAQVDYQRALTQWNFARGAMNDATLALAE